MASASGLLSPGGSRPGSPGPGVKPAFSLTTKSDNSGNLGQEAFDSMTAEQLEAVMNALAAKRGGSGGAPGAQPAGQPPAEQQPPAERQPPAEQQPPAERQPPAEQQPPTGSIESYEDTFLVTMENTLPDLHKMCIESNALSNYILQGCREFKGRHVDRDLVDFLVHMEYQADKNETDEQMKEEIIKYVQNPTSPLPVMEEKHAAAKQQMQDLRIAAVARYYTDAELEFLRKHAPKHLPKIASDIDLLTDFTFKFCPEFKERHPKDDIFELLCFGELIRTFFPKDADAKIQEFIQTKELPRIEDMKFGNDTDLAQQRRQQALNVLEGLRKPQPANVDPAAFYDAAERRNFRKQFIATAEDPAADRCVINDPEIKEPVEATIIGRHPHRRKWLICAIPTNNSKYGKLERFPTIDGDQHRDILENYSLKGSDRTIPVGSLLDLRGISMEEFELNGVILLPWGNDIRISGLGLSNSRNREFKMFSKTVLCQKWGRSGLAMLHAHLQKCGSTIPAGKNKNELELQPKSWYGP
ncbi:hypothetical protein FOCG_16313 [Fusarium oxysporum f. sp. radicis-lycopersici 26381]|nr:hypothetical protein FOCG_16313 [Fusarium oxysporum f. sp. radicis-lycopersici 26381]